MVFFLAMLTIPHLSREPQRGSFNCSTVDICARYGCEWQAMGATVFRRKKKNIMQMCFGIDTRTFKVVRVVGREDGTYDVDGKGPNDNLHKNALETAVRLTHDYISELSCWPVHQCDESLIQEVEADLRTKAEKMKEAAGR
jgi:hypothetical protein